MKKVLFIIFVVLLFSIKVDAQHHRHSRGFNVNIQTFRNNFCYPQPQYIRPVVYIVNQYSVCINTVYYVNQCGYRTGHGYRIFRNYVHYSDGTTVWNDSLPVYF